MWAHAVQATFICTLKTLHSTTAPQDDQLPDKLSDTPSGPYQTAAQGQEAVLEQHTQIKRSIEDSSNGCTATTGVIHISGLIQNGGLNVYITTCSILQIATRPEPAANTINSSHKSLSAASCERLILGPERSQQKDKVR
jgi:hypothetical protein